MDKKKLFKQNGTYNLIQLKTHLQDEGVLDEDTMIDMIKKFVNFISITILTKRTSPIS